MSARRILPVLIALVAVLPSGCGDDDITGPGPEPTEGTRYNETTFLTSHNAFAYFDRDEALPEHGIAVNQQNSIRKQLENGVRCLMLDVYWWQEPEHPLRSEGEVGTWQVWLCHGQADPSLPEPCSQLIFSPLAEELQALADFLSSNPDAFVTLMLEDSVNDEERLLSVFEQSKLGDGRSLMDVSWHPGGDVWNVEDRGEWPLIEWLTWKGLQITIFAGSYDATPRWGHFGLGNRYDNLTPGDLNPYLRNGQLQTERVLLMNHFSGPKLMNGWDLPGVSSPYAVRDVNDYDYTLDRVLQGFAVETGRLPNFLGFDFVDGIPDGNDLCDPAEIPYDGPMRVVQTLNRDYWPEWVGPETVTLTLDDPDPVACDATWQEAGFDLTVMPAPEGECRWEGCWASGEGNGILFNPGRLVVDLSEVEKVFAIRIEYADFCGTGCTTAALERNGEALTEVENEVAGDGVFYLNGLGEAMDQLVFTACDGAIYDIRITYK